MDDKNIANFISTFTHELKTPVNSILGFARLLKNHSLTEEERDEYTEIIISEAERLSRLSEGILLLSRLEKSPALYGTSTLSITEQVRRIIILLQAKWQVKGIEFELSGDEFEVEANSDLLEQVWINLIDNAIKFSPAGGKIHICIQRRQNEAIFAISDEGTGISNEDAEHIFEQFYQADSEHKSEGNGIGLSVVKKICDLHGGSVKIKESTEKGTTFVVELPLVQAK